MRRKIGRAASRRKAHRAFHKILAGVMWITDAAPEPC